MLYYLHKSENMQSSELFNYYLTVNMNNICRICLEKGPQPQKLTPIFDPIKPPHFSNLIMAVASVQVIEGDGFPALICNKCIAKLNMAYQFKMQCEASDTKLRQYFESLQHLPETTDLGGFTIEIKKDPHHLPEQETTLQILQPVPPDMLEDVPGTSHQELEQDHQHTSSIILEVKDPENILDEFKDEVNEYTTMTSNIQMEISEKVHPKDEYTNSVTTGATVKKKSMKQHQCDTCGKIFRTKPGLIHHIRIHTGERPYVCHLCDKRFINGGHLHTHMRTHTGEKNHVCSACSKAFATAQQLTKHTIAIHTSERPYGCTYCPKRFASSSNLNTHVKIHTGEKNYHCDQCGKAFSTKGQLYQHMLVHTGEKAFLCEYCNKRFSQKAHLIRHLKMHK